MKEVGSQIRVTFDPESDAAYIHLADIGRGGVVRTLHLSDDNGYIPVHLDFDAEGRLLGIELLSARSQLPSGLLERLG